MNKETILYNLEERQSDLSLSETYLFSSMGLLFEVGGIAGAITSAMHGDTMIGDYIICATAYIGGRILSTTMASIRNKIRRDSELEELLKN